MSAVRLNDIYEINVNHLLSVRLDTDVSEEFFDKIVFHGTAYNSLLTIAESNLSTYTLTGSYGTGKSTLAAILTGLVHPNIKVRKAVKKLINDDELSSRLELIFNTKHIKNKPWLTIKAVAGISSPIELFQKSILIAIENANLLSCFHDYNLLHDKIKNESQLLEWISKVFDQLEGKISGSLFILDEMGKLLENLARNSGNLHFFQDLSEKIKRLSTEQCPFIFVGILHQSFADYAKGLSHQIAIEWSKIQGRYVDIAYRISLDESIALVSKTIKKTDVKVPRAVYDNNKDLIDNIQNYIGSRLLDSSPKVKQYFNDALPLHPLTTVLLGAVSKSSFSQNERSIFSFLLSVEPYSLRKFLTADVDIAQKYSIVDLWDYLSQNLQHQILSSKEGHAWSVVEQTLTLLSQKINTEKESIVLGHLGSSLIKSIAMMNIFGKTLGVYPTLELLHFAFNITEEENKYIGSCLKKLTDWGLLTFWNATKSYEVVETSELNIQQLINDKLETLSTHQSYLSHIEYKSNIVLAKRHYQEKGIMRWMGQYLINSVQELKNLQNSNDILDNKAYANFILIAEKSLLDAQLKKLSEDHKNFVFARLNNYQEIENWAKEVFVLSQIYQEQPKLIFDPIAKKEYEQRKDYAYQQLNLLFSNAFDSAIWFLNGQKNTEKNLSSLASVIADRLFDKCPIIFNELVVRNDISSSAASGRRKLLEKMLENPEEENLGIEKFPAEKAIYLSCLKQLGLHQYNAEAAQWEFTIPSVEDEVNVVRELFLAGFEHIKARKDLVNISDLYHLWTQAPFGLPQGILPIFTLALLQSKASALAFYDKDVTQEYRFISDMDDEFINKLVKRPYEIAVKYIKEKSEKQKFVNILADSLNDIYEKSIDNSPLQVARFIVSYLVKQSNWVKQSRNTDYFSESTQLLRAVILRADDPFKLLFEEIYDILNAESSTEIIIKSKISDFFIEIDHAKSELLKRFEKTLRNELGELDTSLIQQAEIISKSAADWQLQKFAFHISKSQNHQSKWQSNIITLLSQIPERDWTDDSLNKAFQMIPSFVHRFKQLCYFVKNGQRDLFESDEQKKLSIIVNTSNGFEEFNRDIRVTNDIKEKVDSAMSSFQHTLNTMELNKDTKALILYELLKNYLDPIKLEEN